MQQIENLIFRLKSVKAD